MKYVLKSKNKELLQNQSDLDPDIITQIFAKMSKEKTLKKELGILAGIRNCLKSKESVNEYFTKVSGIKH